MGIYKAGIEGHHLTTTPQQRTLTLTHDTGKRVVPKKYFLDGFRKHLTKYSTIFLDGLESEAGNKFIFGRGKKTDVTIRYRETHEVVDGVYQVHGDIIERKLEVTYTKKMTGVFTRKHSLIIKEDLTPKKRGE